MEGKSRMQIRVEGVCALCCSRLYNYNCSENESQLLSSLLQTVDNAHDGENEERHGFCSNCSSLASTALKSKVELDDTERNVRRLQLELLRELMKLEGQVIAFQRRMKEMDRVVQTSNPASLVMAKHGTQSEQVAQFRTKILKVFRDLKTFSDGICFTRHDHTKVKVKTEVDSDIEASGNCDLSNVPGDNNEDPLLLSPFPIKYDDSAPVADHLFSERSADDDDDDKVEGYREEDDHQSDADLIPDIKQNPPTKRKYSQCRAPRKYSKARRKQIEENKRPCDCDICGKPFTTGAKMKMHRWSHMNDTEKAEAERRLPPGKKYGAGPRPRKFECPICHKMLSRPQRLKTHLESHSHERSQTEAPLHFCDICGKPFKNLKNIKLHRRSHMNEAEKDHIPGPGSHGLPTYQCPTCGKKCSTLDNLKRHKETHNPDRIRIICEKCGKTFISDMSLRGHAKICRASKEKKEKPKKQTLYSCKLCEESFSTRVLRRNHLRDAHGKQETFQCSICSKPFVTARGLREHSELHSDSTRFPCPNNCGAVITNKVSYNRHVARCKGVKEKVILECPVCDKVINKRGLSHHMTAMHGEEPKEKKIFLCSHCPKTFDKKSLLEHHQSAVAGERRYLCRKGCGAGFNFGKSRRRHEESCCGSGTGHGSLPVYVASRTQSE